MLFVEVVPEGRGDRVEESLGLLAGEGVGMMDRSEEEGRVELNPERFRVQHRRYVVAISMAAGIPCGKWRRRTWSRGEASRSS